MNLVKRLNRYIFSRLLPLREKKPEEAYDIWAGQYDNQSDNLMLDLDEKLFTSLMERVSFQNKTVVDVGCGTGRHWKKIYDEKPLKLMGYDVSLGMLKVLNKKFPLAQTYQLQNNKLQNSLDSSCDCLISTLAIAHIQNIEDAFKEWSRILKPNSTIIITDYHPAMFVKGGNRTFVHDGKTIAVKNYIHALEKVRDIMKTLELKEVFFDEIKIDESVKYYYEKKKALSVYERFKGMPVIYGMLLVKGNAVT